MTRALRLATLRCREVEGPALASIRIVVPGGARAESTPGACVLTGGLLEEGTGRQGWRRLSERIESRGMEAFGFGDYDSHGVAMDCLASDLQAAIEVAGEMVAESSFPRPRLELIRSRELQALSAIEESPEAVTGMRFADAIYDGGRRGVPLQGRPGELAAVTREDCVGFHRRGLGRGVIISVAGRIDEEEVRAMVRERFGTEVGMSSLEPTAAPKGDRSGLPGAAVLEVETGALEQCHVFVGHRTVVRSDPDRLALVVLGTILGGGAGNSGRVPARIREDLGLAYSTYAGLAFGTGLDPGYLALYAGTAERHVDAVVREMHHEVDRLVARAVTDEELQGATSFLLGRRPFRRETGRQWANHLVEEALYGLEGEAERLPERLAAMDPGELLEIVRRTIRPDRLQTVIGRPRRRFQGARARRSR